MYRSREETWENSTKFVPKLTKMAENFEKHLSLLSRGVWYLIRRVCPNILSKYCPYLEARVDARLHTKRLILTRPDFRHNWTTALERKTPPNPYTVYF